MSLESVQEGQLLIACLLMQKNERHQLELWLRYHGNLVGLSNLYVFDNGSSDDRTKAILASYQPRGLNVIYDFSEKSDFQEKGRILAEKIKELDRSKPYDFYFPLDTDELLAAEGEDGLHLDRASIEAALLPLKGEKRVLRISHCYNSNPVHMDKYSTSKDQRKSFFAEGACEDLDLGYHQGRSVLGLDTLGTDIVYIHCHSKNYYQTLYNSFQKLEGRLPSFNDNDLDKHYEMRREGYHLVPALRLSREEYYSRHYAEERRLKKIPEIREALERVNAFDLLRGLMQFDFMPADSDAERGGDASASDSIFGYVDKVVIGEGERLFIRGWSSSKSGMSARMFRVRAGSWFQDVRPSALRQRPDVYRTMEKADLFSGFELDCPLPPNEDDIITLNPLGRDAVEHPALKSGFLKAPLTVHNIRKATQNPPPFLAALLRRFVGGFAAHTVFDVGANVGQSAFDLRAIFPDAKIYCFEPSPSTFRTLKQRLEGWSNLELHHMALGAERGVVHVSDRNNSTMNRVDSRDAESEGVPVRMETIDAFCVASGIEEIDYLKIDTEGHDLEVLRGCGEFITKMRMIECEVSANTYNTYHVAFSDVFSFLSERGFSLFHIAEQTMEWQDGGRPLLRRFNAIFVSNALVGSLDGVVCK